MTTVLAFGTFDVLHPGHLSYLKQAKRMGERLIVVLSRDETVATLKGRKPVFSEKERKEIIESLKIVGHAVLGLRGDDHYKIIELLKPDVVCLGYDHAFSVKELASELRVRGLKGVRVVRARPHKPERYKSHILKAHH